MAEFNLKALYPRPAYVLTEKGEELRKEVIKEFNNFVNRKYDTEFWVDATPYYFDIGYNFIEFKAFTIPEFEARNIRRTVKDLKEYIRPY